MYQVYIGKLPLPIAPAKIETSFPSRNVTVSLIGGEEINILKQPGLAEISFDFLVPAQNYPFVTLAGSLAGMGSELLGSLSSLGNAAMSTAITWYLEELKKNRTPVQLIIARLGQGLSVTNAKNFNMTVALEDYSIKEDAEEYGLDSCVSVFFKQYRPYTTKILDNNGKITAKRG